MTFTPRQQLWGVEICIALCLLMKVGDHYNWGRDPRKDFDSKFKTALQLSQEGKYREALESYQELRQESLLLLDTRDPQRREIEHQRGLALLACSNPAPAEHAFRKALQLAEWEKNPQIQDTFPIRWGLIQALAAQRNRSDTVTECKVLLELQEHWQGPLHAETRRTRDELQRWQAE